jgi:cytochrome c553
MIRLLATIAGAACFWLALWPVGAAAQTPAAKPDAAKGHAIAGQTCAACHAADGNSQIAANPKLAGQIYEYLHKQMVNFKPQGSKKAERDNAVMAGMIANLGGRHEDVAPPRSANPSPRRPRTRSRRAREDLRAADRHRRCRLRRLPRPAGAGMPAQYPRIAGQFSEYVEAQLKAFRAGARANDPNGMRRGVVTRMSDREIQAVAEYVAGLR